MTNLRWFLVLAVALTLGGAATAQPTTAPETAESKHMARIALVDWVVTGQGEPRYWLGPMQAEVLARRLRLSYNFLITDPYDTRQTDSGVAATDLDGLLLNLAAQNEQHQAAYVISGLIEDRGDKLLVQPVALVRGNDKPWLPRAQEVSLEQVFQPQADLIIGQLTRQMGLKLNPDQVKAMREYVPTTAFGILEQVGNGWRAWRPDAPQAAAQRWREAATMDPDDVFVADALALALLAERRILVAESIKRAVDQVANRPDDPYAYFELGRVHSDAGNWLQAEKAFELAIDRRQTFVEAHLGRGVARMQMGYLNEAQSSFDQVLIWEPTNLKGLYNAGLCAARQGDTARAIDIWGRGRRYWPNEPLFREALTRINAAGLNPATQGLQ
ncbi:MAG TPA: hypothetical protein DCZ72_05230 [Armatimonadetes bacterium]|nr:hypothetical protein [Armatimonadota bacterium]